ncbi:hypothetical protein PCO87_11415 [Pectobacteriaceae bacterium C52]|nr:hypothetical protein PCO87_11415 [Pectobacteriaceae bacterium C52]
MIDVERLPHPIQKIIARLAKYISVVLLATILAGAVHQLGDRKGFDFHWLIPIVLAWMMSAATSLKSWHLFLLSLGCWGILTWMF